MPQVPQIPLVPQAPAIDDGTLDDLLAKADPGQIMMRIHERKRKLEHAAAKAAQPEKAGREELRDALRAPLTPGEMDPHGLDYLMLTVQDCIETAPLTDLIHALVRVYRKAWAMQRHLGPSPKVL